MALGKVNEGAFSNDDATYGKFETALAASGEKFWRLPLGEEYAEMIKSDIGDIKNTGGRYGRGEYGGGVFEGVCRGDAVDSSGHCRDGMGGGARPYIAKGPSGIAVRSILEWVRSY